MITIIKDYNEYATALCDRHINRLYEKKHESMHKTNSKGEKLSIQRKKG